MPLIGTAGHVDHGKSTLIQKLTGRDPDRWAEEKERGLTIDLGFAWKVLPNGLEVSFVDVPGHERYVKNMLAGVEAVDVALFVVAADEGWMPQSEEHLAVLDLLEVERGLVALTKCDLVDTELVELATLEVEEQLEGTSLEGIGIVPVSGVTGEGTDTLVSQLESLLGGHTSRDRGRPRLWVDRVFTVGGAGTVVTGTLLDGSLAVGDSVVVLPDSREARVRSIQTHERSVETVEPGRRVALNLAGLDRAEVVRGDMIGVPGNWLTTSRFLGSVRLARYVEELSPRGDYQVHIGSQAVPVDVVGLDGVAAVIRTAHPVPVAAGDRYVIRDTGRKLVVAGGRVLDPAPGRTRTSLASAATLDPEATPNDLATTLLRQRGIESLSTLEAHSGGGRPTGAVIVGDVSLTTDMYHRLQSRAVDAVAAHHQRHPLRVGLPMATLAEQLGTPASVAEAVVDTCETLVRIGPEVALEGRMIELSSEQESQRERLRTRIGANLAVPSVKELGADPELLHLMVRNGELVRISGDLMLLPEQVEKIKGTLATLPEAFTVAEFRDATGLSRKYAVPLLEWMDMEGLTVRRGDTRSVR